MVPWQVAAGLTISASGVALLLLPDWLPYLQGRWGAVVAAHGWGFGLPALTALAGLFASIHWAARKAGLGDLGRKVEHIDRGLRADGAAHDRELAEALRRDREARWGAGGPAG